jgi:iduronate 2-sulfatase
LANPNSHWDRPAISQVTRTHQGQHAMGYSVRTERHRYTIWTQGGQGEELYDYKTDPRELHNLAADRQSSALKKKLRATLEQICHARGMASAFAGA